MKFYLVDDDLFCNGKQQNELRYRFIKHLQRNRVKQIFIRVTHDATEHLQSFLKQYHSIPVYLVEDDFVLHDEQKDVSYQDGIFHVDGYEDILVTKGCCVEYDCDVQTTNRIYFDLFVNHTQEEMYDELIDELKSILEKNGVKLNKKGKGF